MSKRFWVLALGALAFTLTACNKIGGGSSHDLKTMKDKSSYGIGRDIGKSFKQQLVGAGDLELDKVMAGIEDELADKKSLLSDAEVRETMSAFQQKMMAKQDSVNRKLGEENGKLGEAFLAKNAKEEGVVTLPDGLQYKVLKQGNGKKPDTNSTVTVNYRGTFVDGTEFDNSYTRGQPATFPIKGVLRGWVEALQLMPVGSKWKIVLPSSLAYGPNGAGPKIGPNSTLIFEVELLAVN
ncbi:MAG TPA: hypothetical protein DCQ83_03660 [Fibrobacteres bacterium]|jgi:FKBP-type peptidyl-prolyl cis-trans isomerase FklB|nr:hypothetical protein [Fibrobacterota bacterium]